MNFILLYVENPTASAAFYGDLLGKKPLEASPTFAMFELGAGLMLGLWARDTVDPKPSPLASTAAKQDKGHSEVAFALPDNAQVDAKHAEWKKKGLIIAQPPTKMDFGHTFVALDPDGHRLRVYAPSRD